jgi:8-oxo-dGTP pyrophosphatase MutT (NUDIX family)
MPPRQVIHCAGVVVFRRKPATETGATGATGGTASDATDTAKSVPHYQQYQTILVVSKKGGYGFPKGKKEQREANMQCALRELKEETGIEASDLKLLDKTIFIERSILYHVGVHGLSNHVPTFDPNELRQVEWLDMSPTLDGTLAVPISRLRLRRGEILQQAFAAFLAATAETAESAASAESAESNKSHQYDKESGSLAAASPSSAAGGSLLT